MIGCRVVWERLRDAGSGPTRTGSTGATGSTGHTGTGRPGHGSYVRTFNITAGRGLGTDPDRFNRSGWLYRSDRDRWLGTTRITPVPGRTCRIHWRYWTDARLRRRFQPGFPEAAFSVSGKEIVGTRWLLGTFQARWADGSLRARARDTVPAGYTGVTGSTGVTGRRLYW
jgi:hypothetical protein